MARPRFPAARRGHLIAADEALARGLNAHDGVLTNRGVADAFPDLPYAPVADVVGARV
ncbi:MAG TPA: hypothetical protein VJR25_00445 [Microbacterium sp.]|uniref:hypothetical protein n=1 Tax=Microbacterium sp. TaxID=51671 RepID=UPI002B49C11D|nr:hypothetical protein [Microbacterium sp.]HKT55213.1 hypothetical protein [Microbacterium sp.]